MFAFLLLSACGSAAGDRCDLEPVGAVNSFFVGENASRDVVVTVASIAPLEGIAGFRYDMRDGARLTWMAKEPMANVVAGGTVSMGTESTRHHFDTPCWDSSSFSLTSP